MSRIIYYRKKCIGCGICYERQPDYWRMSRKDGKANLIGSTENKEIHIKLIFPPLKKTILVVKSCPARAIKLLPQM